jgi:hypothetical protein
MVKKATGRSPSTSPASNFIYFLTIEVIKTCDYQKLITCLGVESTSDEIPRIEATQGKSDDADGLKRWTLR